MFETKRMYAVARLITPLAALFALACTGTPEQPDNPPPSAGTTGSDATEQPSAAPTPGGEAPSGQALVYAVGIDGID